MPERRTPNIKICLTLLYGKQHLISQIYKNPDNPDQKSADAFAENVVTYLKHYGLNGFDIDWEWHYLSDDTTQAQFKTTFSAVGPALRAAGKKRSEIGIITAVLGVQVNGGYTGESQRSEERKTSEPC